MGDLERSMVDADAKRWCQNGFRKRRRRLFLAATPLIHHDRHDRHLPCTHLAHPYPRLTSHIHTLHIPYTNLTHPYPHHTLHIPRNLMDDHLLAYQFLNRFLAMLLGSHPPLLLDHALSLIFDWRRHLFGRAAVTGHRLLCDFILGWTP